jgi:pimeloyl-ACP methyl ester carboxylesterase
VTEKILSPLEAMKILRGAVKESGHCPFLEEADKFNQVLSRFMEDNR